MAVKKKCYCIAGVDLFPAIITSETSGAYTWVEAIAGSTWVTKPEGRSGSAAKEFEGTEGLYSGTPLKVIMYQFEDASGNISYQFAKEANVTVFPAKITGKLGPSYTFSEVEIVGFGLTIQVKPNGRSGNAIDLNDLNILSENLPIYVEMIECVDSVGVSHYGFWGGYKNKLLDGSYHEDTVETECVASAIVVGNSENKWSALSKGSEDQVLTISGGEVSWSNNKNHLLDGKFHSDTASVSCSTGALIMGNGSSKWDKLSKGVNDSTLQVNAAGSLEWRPAKLLDQHAHVDCGTYTPEKGSLVVGIGNEFWSGQSVGSDFQVLMADSTESNGVKWHTLIEAGTTEGQTYYWADEDECLKPISLYAGESTSESSTIVYIEGVLGVAPSLVNTRLLHAGNHFDTHDADAEVGAMIIGKQYGVPKWDKLSIGSEGDILRVSSSGVPEWVETQDVEVVTGVRVEGTTLQIKTRSIKAIPVGDESDWTTIHTGTECE